MMRMWKWMVVVLAVLSLLAVNVGAQDYPKGPINYWVPFPAGGESDIEIRTLQPFLEKSLGVPLVINYVTGAGGALCWSKLAAAKPDGYTIGGVNMPANILQPEFMKDVNFKVKDFAYLTLIEYTPNGLAVKKDFKANTLKEFIEYAKANPGKVNCGGVGRFTGLHMGFLQMMKLTGIKVNYVTFNGNAPLQTALLGGHIDAAFNGSVQLVATKNDVKVLAIGSEKRMGLLPDVPTFKESGLDYYPRTTRGVIVPKGAPLPIQKRLEKAFQEAVARPEFKAKMEAAGFVIQGLGSADAEKYIESESVLMHRLIQDFNLLQPAQK
jgi:tripartite-type tricarboxylate transporter receptor subunit TctC